ncbi:hypothetical protein [Lichenicola sp.]
MDAILLLLECAGIFLVLRWVVAGQGSAGLLAWRPSPGPDMKARRRRPR